jgi:uncharacterized membrane protein
MEQKSLFARWRSSFLTGLAVTLPALLTLAAVKWLIGTISSVTDVLLFFLPKSLTHESLVYPHDGKGEMLGYWKLVALALAVVLISAVGVLARYYIGKKIIDWTDRVLMRVPFLNKIYAAIKQVNDAFAGNKHSFKTVVLVEFPREGIHSIGFLTSEQHDEVQQKTREKVVCVFVPTTPNPTSGFLILVPEEKVVKLKMSVADAIKYIVSLGSLSPEYTPPPPEKRG